MDATDEIERMRARIEQLRGALKSASGRFLDIGGQDYADKCMEWAGDMEEGTLRRII